MKTETGCDAVMIGRGAMGNPWLFRRLAAIERGAADPGPPSLAERAAVFRRHGDLVMRYLPEKLRLHEIRKTVAWYSRGLRGGAELRQAAFAFHEPAALIERALAFFAGLAALGDETPLHTRPADPIAKAIARNARESGTRVEADEACAA
jgi:tRNA-dihydrouridine synthase